MSELEQIMVIRCMDKLDHDDRQFMLGVMAGMAAKQERREQDDHRGDRGESGGHADGV